MGDEATTSLTFVSTSAYHGSENAPAQGKVITARTGSGTEEFGIASGEVEYTGERKPLLGKGADTGAPSDGKGALARDLTLINAIGLVVGSIIGSGIFITPNQVLEQTGSVGVSFFVWIGCGVLAIGGALCFCELGTSIPNAGATYAYILRAFGGLPAFLYIWTAAFVIRPASRAIISLAFAEYLSRPFYGPQNNNLPNSSNSTLNFTLMEGGPDDDFDPREGPAPVWLVKLLAALCVSKFEHNSTVVP